MTRATFVSLHLARFDILRSAGELFTSDLPGVLFASVAADTRAAGTEPASQQAFKFVMLGLHEDEASAHHLVDRRSTLAPWLNDARDVWAAVLQPYRHKGEANYLDRAQPGALFDALAPPVSPASPFVVITSSGWNTGDGLDMNKVREFSTGVMAVRMAMSGVAGLDSQQSFFFPRVLEFDPLTVTFWRDDASVRAFAYAGGVHRHHMDLDREQSLADRTSFTRCRVVRSEGTWPGVDARYCPGS